MIWIFVVNRVAYEAYDKVTPEARAGAGGEPATTPAATSAPLLPNPRVVLTRLPRFGLGGGHCHYHYCCDTTTATTVSLSSPATDAPIERKEVQPRAGTSSASSTYPGPVIGPPARLTIDQQW
ncbi:hypothetical protein DPMN_060450 [Dreissena polymorpha]|uniref:Uncharacterized protein n=1 Tax=Dreissena polymorpha TaxID=45954 RepID=A0A9D4C5M0_DREPO|nr:hypothetical protein DPMN_060450 [Dreissena polymorpha]